MRIALIARPQWEGQPPPPKFDARVIDAPLQMLALCEPKPDVFQALARAAHPWVIFTSPASVQAMDQWMASTGMDLMQNDRLGLAAVGSGTRQAILDKSDPRAAQPSRAWQVGGRDIVVSVSDERADAVQLLQALDAEQFKRSFVWSEQTVLLAQGEASRATLADGLRERGAHVLALDLYRRKDVAWSDAIWQILVSSQAGEVGVVVTSSTVIARLMQELAAHGISAGQLVWCTQHLAIATRLKAAGVETIRRVALMPSALEKDLFEHEQYW